MRFIERFKKDGNFLFRYRSYLPLILVPFFIFSLISFSSNLINCDAKWLGYNNILIIFSLIVGLLGQTIRILVAGFVPKDTSGRNTKEQKAATLNTKGFYSICRNPLYLGNFLMMFSPVILLGNWLFALCFILFFWLYYERIIYAEEEFLVKKFGDLYIQWASKTSCFFPSFRNYEKTNMKFSFKAMIRREYHSLFGLASSLFVVHYLIILVLFKFDVLAPSYILSGFFIICFIIYLICLFLSKKTNLLFVENR